MTAPDWLLQKPFAHRGLFDERRPENSVSAIEAAIEAGFPIEIDVQTSADGQVIVFHDWTLQRLTDRADRVCELPAKTICGLRLLGTDHRVARLDEVLDVVNGRIPVLIEIKNRRQPCALEPELSRILRGYDGPFAIQSFNPFSLGWFRRHHPEICRGQISCDFDTDDMAGWKKKILSNYGMNWMSRPAFISHHWKHLPAVVPRLLRSLTSLPLLAWTIRNPKEHAAALQLADNVIFENFLPSSDSST